MRSWTWFETRTERHSSPTLCNNSSAYSKPASSVNSNRTGGPGFGPRHPSGAEIPMQWRNNKPVGGNSNGLILRGQIDALLTLLFRLHQLVY
jgi:hypothetical protein